MAKRTEPALIGIREVAAILGISQTTARELAAKGELPGVLPEKVGNQWRCNRKAVLAFVDSHRTNGKKAG
jgi:excisionase family DNA binding protein